MLILALALAAGNLPGAQISSSPVLVIAVSVVAVSVVAVSVVAVSVVAVSVVAVSVVAPSPRRSSVVLPPRAREDLLLATW
ncbi:MAG: hypothetical protein ACYCXN_03785 [Acidimicrobiales bacterium]